MLETVVAKAISSVFGEISPVPYEPPDELIARLIDRREARPPTRHTPNANTFEGREPDRGTECKTNGIPMVEAKSTRKIIELLDRNPVVF